MNKNYESATARAIMHGWLFEVTEGIQETEDGVFPKIGWTVTTPDGKRYGNACFYRNANQECKENAKEVLAVNIEEVLNRLEEVEQ